MDTSTQMKRILVDNDVLENKNIKTETTVEADFINSISVPTLESIAIVKVATSLCKQPDVRNTMRQHSLEFDPVGRMCRGTSHDDSVNQIENNILSNLSLLPLPNLFKVKVSNVIRPIELQILKWISGNRKDIEYIDSICYTSEGTIDKIKTLKKLINRDTVGLYIHSFYKLACKYCLEESIPDLWDKLPAKLKKTYLNSSKLYKEYDNHLIAYWTHTINNQLSKLFSKIKPSDRGGIYDCQHSVYKNMFALALFKGNSLAIKYFWNKLTVVEISNHLNQWVNDAVENMKDYGTRSDILYFLISKMSDKEQQTEVLHLNSDVILNTLLKDWPWQKFLLPTIKRIWNILDKNVYVKLLGNIAPQIMVGKTTEQLFNRLWCDSPMNLKKYYIQRLLKGFHCMEALCNLLVVKDIGTVKAILDYANVEEYKNIIFSLTKSSGFFEVIYADRLPLFSVLIEKLSETDINRIKETIVDNHGRKLCHEWTCNNNLKEVDKFLNWAFTTPAQIDDFKNKIIDKIQITYDLFFRQNNHELVNKFLSWCFDSNEEKINQFKKSFAKSKPKIVELGYRDWYSFEKFLDWCFDSELEIDHFKSNVLQSYEMQKIVFSSIAYGYNFEFIDKLISWCCHSSEEIKQYNAQFVFSEEWIEILQKFVRNYKVYDSEWNNWELVKKLMKLFSPLEEDIITKLKGRIANCTCLYGFYEDFKHRSFRIRKKDLFRLLDNDSYDIGDRSGSDSD